MTRAARRKLARDSRIRIFPVRIRDPTCRGGRVQPKHRARRVKPRQLHGRDPADRIVPKQDFAFRRMQQRPALRV